MTQPEVGLPTARGGGCAFQSALDEPECGAPATLHVIVTSHGWGNHPAGLNACDRHVPIARASAPMLTEHPFQDVCLSGECVAVGAS